MTSESLYRKVAEDIKAAIAAGAYPPGALLPSEAELAERYAVSRGTVRQAFAALRADGVIASRRGARRVVIGGPRVQSFGELLSFSRWARAIGEVPSAAAWCRWSGGPATMPRRRRLGLADGGLVYSLVRVRLLSGRPVMVERAVYPEKVGALVAGFDLTVDSITERLEELGVAFTDAEHVIDAVRRVGRGRPLARGAGRRAAAARAAVHHRPRRAARRVVRRPLPGLADGVQRAQLRLGQRAVPHVGAAAVTAPGGPVSSRAANLAIQVAAWLYLSA